MTDMTQRISMKAILVHDGKVLLLRKALYEGNAGNEGKWNTPGGRIEPGENWQVALKREVKEEAGIDGIEIEYPIYVGEWQPVISGVPTQIICTFLVCSSKTSEVVLNGEHDRYEWINPEDRGSYDILSPEGEVIDRYREWQAKLAKH